MSVRHAVLQPLLAIPLAVAAALLLDPLAAAARPTIRSSFFAAYPTTVGSRIEDTPSHPDHCGMCHLDFNGAGPKNAYGNRLAQVIGNYSNNDAGRQQAMRFIENEDPDADGFTTLTELTNTVTYTNTPTFPGLTPANVGSVSNVVVGEITGYLVPTTGADTQAPVVTVTSPNGAESWTGGVFHNVTWTATDNTSVASVNVFYRDGASAPWTMIARNLANTGSFPWAVHNTPTTGARVKVVAYDVASNAGADSSNANFTLVATPGGIAPTTLRDVHMPGTQPFGGGAFEVSDNCITCHGGYDPAVEPGRNFRGSMMAQSGRDPIFFACLAIAEQDAPGSGDLCLRCHMPFGWMSGRSQPTSGAGMIPGFDFDGVSCDMCHRLVDPIYEAGVNPVEDVGVLAGLLPGHTPTEFASGMYVIDPVARKRGPFTDPATPHAFLASPFHRSSDLCGTCHNVSNPVFERTGIDTYAAGPLDQQASAFGPGVLMPLERTYSEWLASDYPGGVYAPQFAGSKPGGMVAECQDCHMPDVSGKGCNDPVAPLRANLPLHDLTGGNAWMPGVVAAMYPAEVDAAALAAGAGRAVSMLQRAALLGLQWLPAGDSMHVTAQVTNQAGHKLPTGYPEGRRMWLEVIASDHNGQTVFHSGAYDASTGVLAHDAHAQIYETKLGISTDLAAALAQPRGESFHFVLNDTIVKDNRIPPSGFTNAAFTAFGAHPKDPDWAGPGPRYPDGQNWDSASYPLPPNARSAVVHLWYQTTSKEYIEFLRDQNTTNAAGQAMYDAWVAHGRAAPVLMATDSISFSPTGVPEPATPAVSDVRLLRQPARGAVEMALVLQHLSDVTLEVYDVRGRVLAQSREGLLAAGEHRLRWDGIGSDGRDAGTGVFWLRVHAGSQVITRQVVRLR